MFKAFTRIASVPPVRRVLTPPQLRFLGCRAKRRTCCSGRRSGKSFAVAVWLVEEWADRPGQSSIMIALSQEHAVRIAWDTIRTLNDKLGWGAIYNGTDGTWTWPNGFTLYFMGCKDRRSANYIRGVPKIHRVAVDECGQIPDALLKYLVEDVVEPTLADTDGSLCLTGTPSDTGVGFYEDEMGRAEADGAHFCWTAADNPHLEVNGAQFIAHMLATRFAGNEANATFRREYLGHRVREEGVLVYHLPPLSEFYAQPPARGNYTAMGIDLGWADGTGFSVLRARDPLPGAHIMEVYRETELQLPRIAAIAARLQSQYDVAEIFVDSAGGGGRTICETLANSYGLPAQPADKRARRMRIEMVRTMLDARTLTGTDGLAGQFVEECRGLPWNEDRNDHREGWVDETIDATQYALQGSGFSQLTSWDVEPTPEEAHEARIRAVQRARQRRAGRR